MESESRWIAREVREGSPKTAKMGVIPICQIIRKSINANPAPKANLIPLLLLQMLWVSELEDSLFFAPEKLILSA